MTALSELFRLCIERGLFIRAEYDAGEGEIHILVEWEDEATGQRVTVFEAGGARGLDADDAAMRALEGLL